MSTPDTFTRSYLNEFFNVEREFAYPYPETESDYINTRFLISWPHRCRTHLDSALYRIKNYRHSGIILQLLGDRPFLPLQDSDFPAILLTHNSGRFLRSFLAHYRRLGVTRFLCVDDQTTDDSLDYLLSQPDVDVYRSDVRYSEANRGRVWRELLARKYGYHRWYLNLDDDEYFVYPEMHTVPLPQLTSRLHQHGIRRICAPMLDMYPNKALEEAVFDGSDDRFPWEVAPCFDGTGYAGKILRKGLSLCGGIRQRLLGVTPELVKYPLLYWSPRVSLGKTIHFPLPAYENFTFIGGALLHFKIFSDFRELICNNIKNGQHVGGGHFYRKLLEGFDRLGHNTLEYEHSVTYSDADDLQKRGFMSSLPSNEIPFKSSNH